MHLLVPLGNISNLFREYVDNANCVLRAGLNGSSVFGGRHLRPKRKEIANGLRPRQALVFIVLVPICVIYILPIYFLV